MRLLHVMGSLHPSGMERMLVSAAPHFSFAGVESYVLGCGIGHPYERELRGAGYKVDLIASTRTTRGLRQLRSAVRRIRPDVIHVHTEGAFGAVVPVLRSAAWGTPVVRTIHNVFEPRSVRDRISRRTQALVADRLVKRFVAVSSDVADNERRFGRECLTILNWVDDRYQQLNSHRDDSPQVPRSAVMGGNSSPLKNHILALQVVTDLGLDLYFHGSEAGASNQEVGLLDGLAAAGRIRHRGTDDPSASLMAADVYLMPSLREGMPVALAEALTVGVPCVVADSVGLQWSRDYPGVRLAALNAGVWREEVARCLTGPRTYETAGEDFRAARGASDYVAAYRDALA